MKRKLLEEYITGNPINFIAISFVYLTIYLFFPYSFFAELFADKVTALGIINTAVRIFFAIIPIAIYCVATRKIVCEKTNFKRFIYAVPILLVSFNNIPFFSLARGSCELHFTYLTFSHYLVDCLSVGVLEEVIFRGIIFPLFIRHFCNDEKAIFKSIVYSSLLFGIVHFFNLLSGANFWLTLLQVGYSFLMGSAFAIAYYLTENLIVPILLHTVYNFGGLLIDGNFISGYIWTNEQVFMTVLIAIAVIVYCVKWIIKINRIYYWGNE